MAFDKLNFTKSWRTDESLPYFPTFEDGETQVRQDMQQLHNETRTTLNGLINALAESTAADEIGAVDSDGNASTVQDELDARVLTDNYDPVAKTNVMTQPVGVDTDGKLYTTPFSAGVQWGGIGGTISNQTDLTDNFSGINHTHGNITNDGKIGAVDLDNTLAHVVDGKLKTLAGNLAGTQLEILIHPGNGSYGVANKCSITFSFTPKLVSFYGYKLGDDPVAAYRGFDPFILWGVSESTAYIVGTYVSYTNVTFSGNTMTWWDTESAARQFNSATVSYYIIAIG